MKSFVCFTFVDFIKLITVFAAKNPTEDMSTDGISAARAAFLASKRKLDEDYEDLLSKLDVLSSIEKSLSKKEKHLDNKEKELTQASTMIEAKIASLHEDEARVASWLSSQGGTWFVDL